MKGLSNISTLHIKLLDKYESKLVNIFFWLFVMSFFIDRIINYFLHFPFFVISALLLFPFLFFIVQNRNPDKRQLYVLVFSFLVITILNSIVYLFGVKNISDLLFIILFFTAYFYYRNNIKYLKISNIYIFFVLNLFLFSFTFVGMDSNSRNAYNYSSSLSWINYYDENPEKEQNVRLNTPPKKKPGKSNKSTKKKKPRIEWESNPLDKIERNRVHYFGLFRHPHMASYFFGFLFLFFAYQYQKTRKVINIILLTISLIICIYAGAKALLVALVLSLIVFLFRRKYLFYLILITVFFIILIVTNEYFLQITKDTVFYQYFSFIKTSTANISLLSRYRLAYSWWIEIREFGILDFIIGKSYINSMIANSRNLGINVWFHNDFLSISYTYGIWAIMLYIYFFVKIYRDNKLMIKQNIFIFVFYCSMIFSAIFNGFYYYFPVFLLYIFFLMIKNEKQMVE